MGRGRDRNQVRSGGGGGEGASEGAGAGGIEGGEQRGLGGGEAARGVGRWPRHMACRSATGRPQCSGDLAARVGAWVLLTCGHGSCCCAPLLPRHNRTALFSSPHRHQTPPAPLYHTHASHTHAHRLLQPVILRQFLQWLSNYNAGTPDPEYQGWLLAVALGCCGLLFAVIHHQLFWWVPVHTPACTGGAAACVVCAMCAGWVP